MDDFEAARRQLTPLAGGGASDETVYDYDETNDLNRDDADGRPRYQPDV